MVLDEDLSGCSLFVNSELWKGQGRQEKTIP